MKTGKQDAMVRRVLDALSSSRSGPLNPKDLARAASISTPEYRSFRSALSALEHDGRIYRVKGNRYGLPRSLDLATGHLSVTGKRDAFLRRDDAEGDVFVSGADLNTAMDGDRVVVRIEHRPRHRSPVGTVIKILERSHTVVVGTFHRGRRLAYVSPLNRRLFQDVVIPAGEEGDAGDGDVVVVRIVSYGEHNVGPVGEVERVLGALDDPGVDVLAVAVGYGLSLEFSPELERVAWEVAARAEAEPGPGRVDRTDLLVVTIDPADAKDHDDALSVRSLEGERWEVGVHIADVAHFVVAGGPIDMEARDRGTSVYLVDRVIPMLPHHLSGNACSLRPDVDRFAVSAFLTLDAGGRVLERRYERTVVRSRHRLSYEQVQEVLDGRGSIDVETDAALRALDDLARTIRATRKARGALDLDLPEAKVILDAEGLPVDIRRVNRLESHRLIEDFMILANEMVAEDCEAKGLPVLFRVHESPTPERVDELREFLSRLGHRLPKRGAIRPSDVQRLLESTRGKPEETLVSTVVLRSMKRARYEGENLGHFGLASESYLHFTSPIRRYPDLVVHRMVVRGLIDGMKVGEGDQEELDALGELCSAREEAADGAERDSIALKKVEFMERHLGEEFDGVISGVTAFGFFVTLDRYFVDGLVHVNTLRDDFYRFEEGSYQLVGDRGRRRYRLGDGVRVQVSRVNKEERHVDLLLVRHPLRRRV
ncbi:MAG: ribonuclease R [Gemmatimonadota bacterium]|nr:ribonuclease R [Gemmatimonadota bacterium]MDH5760915.1 ribonuclease R [Gemmatimonadota bacterium]